MYYDQIYVVICLSEEYTIDLSNIPLKPMGKKDIQRLEMGLIIATLYSPEVLELIKDPIERSTWVDSLAVAAAALAREKAGYTISQIAEEVGRSETTIRAHLTGKTKAGKLVRDTYEKLKSGQLKIIVPVIKVEEKMVATPVEVEKQIEEIKARYESEINNLNERINNLEKENEELRAKIREQEEIINIVKNIAGLIKDLMSKIGV